MGSGLSKRRLETLAKEGEAIYYRRSPKAAKDGRIPTFKLARGVKLEKAVKRNC